MFWETSQDSQENRPEACNFIKTETLAYVVSCEFCEISKNNFFTEHIWATASATCRHKSSEEHIFSKIVSLLLKNKFYGRLFPENILKIVSAILINEAVVQSMNSLQYIL